MRAGGLFIALAIFFLGNLSQGQALNHETSLAEQQAAEKAWAELVKVKGGSERLHSLTNMLTKFGMPYGVTRLHVFPDRLWHFTYYLDLSPELDVYDGKTQTWHLMNGIDEAVHEDRTSFLMEEQLPFLLETKFYKPQLIRVRRTKLGSKSVDVIETIVGRHPMDFVYEPEEMLVSEIWFHHDDGTVWQKYQLSHYSDIAGIKMPQSIAIWTDLDKFSDKKPRPMPITFEFNVDYDPKIFEPPFRATSPDAWKRKP